MPPHLIKYPEAAEVEERISNRELKPEGLMARGVGATSIGISNRELKQDVNSSVYNPYYYVRISNRELKRTSHLPL